MFKITSRQKVLPFLKHLPLVTTLLHCPPWLLEVLLRATLSENMQKHGWNNCRWTCGLKAPSVTVCLSNAKHKWAFTHVGNWFICIQTHLLANGSEGKSEISVRTCETIKVKMLDAPLQVSTMQKKHPAVMSDWGRSHRQTWTTEKVECYYLPKQHDCTLHVSDFSCGRLLSFRQLNHFVLLVQEWISNEWT